MAFEPAWKREVREANRQAAEMAATREARHAQRRHYAKFADKNIAAERKAKVERMSLPYPLMEPETQAGIERFARAIQPS